MDTDGLREAVRSECDRMSGHLWVNSLGFEVDGKGGWAFGKWGFAVISTRTGVRWAGAYTYGAERMKRYAGVGDTPEEAINNAEPLEWYRTLMEVQQEIIDEECGDR